MLSATVAKVGLTATMVLGAIAVVAQVPVAAAPRYLMVDQLGPARAVWRGTPLKLHGWVVPGSVAGRSFVLEKAGARIRVVTHDPLPEAVRDSAEIVAAGRLDATLALDASELFTRCASHYDGARLDGARPAFK